MIRFIDSIARELVKEFPTHPIYIQGVPTNFVRPSFYIRFVLGDKDELSSTVIGERLSFQLVYFEEKTENDIVDVGKQLGELLKLKRPFMKGSMLIEGTGGRYATINGVRSSMREEELLLDLDFYITNLEPLDEGSEEVYDLMLNIQTKYNIIK